MYRSELNYTDWLGVVYEDPVFRSTATNPVIEQLDGTNPLPASIDVSLADPQKGDEIAAAGPLFFLACR